MKTLILVLVLVLVAACRDVPKPTDAGVAVDAGACGELHVELRHTNLKAVCDGGTWLLVPDEDLHNPDGTWNVR